LDDEKLLKKIESLKGNQKESWDDLSYEDQHAIEEGLTQLNEGKSVSYNEVRKEIKSLLNPKL
jgi:predicted transcriptional regulator